MGRGRVTRPVTRVDSFEQQITALTAPAPPRFPVGQIVAIDPTGAVTVNLGGYNWPATRIVDTPLSVGDNVLLLREGRALTILGPIAPTARPVTGTVASVPSNSWTLLVTTSIGTISAYYPSSYGSPAAGDQVLLIWQGSVAIAVKQGSNGTPGPLPVNPPPSTPLPPPTAPNTGTQVFQAVASGTYSSNNGWQAGSGGHVIAGPDTVANLLDIYSGAWFLGRRIPNTLHGATVEQAWIYLGRDSGGSDSPQTVHLYRVNDVRRPAGALDFTATTVDVVLEFGQRGWFELPASFAQELVDSGGSVGVQAPSGPYVVLWGLAQSGMAGAIKIAWRKDT